MFYLSRRCSLMWAWCALLAIPGFASAQETWVGKVVLVKRSGIQIGRTGKDGKPIYLDTLTEPNYVVSKEQDGWIKVRTRRRIEGWFSKNDAVLLEQAPAYFTGVMQQMPADAWPHYMRGVASFLREASDAALQDFNNAIRLDPKHVQARMLRGRLLSGRGDTDGGMRDLDEAVRLAPNNYLAFLVRGQIWQDRKEFDKAIKDFNEVIRLNPGEVDAFVDRGQCYDAKKDYDQALKDFGEAIRLDPENVDAYTSRAFVWRDKKEPEKAIKDFSEVVRLDPMNPEPLCSRGGIRQQATRDYAGALADFTAAMKLDEKSPVACNLCAWLLATCADDKIRDGKKAAELARKAIQLSGEKDAACFDTLAAALAETGDFDGAVLNQMRALKDESFVREFGEPARKRLELYKNKMTVRE